MADIEANPEYARDMEKAFKKGNISEIVDSLKDEEYKKYIQQKYDMIIQAFQKIDKNGNQSIDKNELMEFLDNNMTVFLVYLGRQKVW